LFEESIKKQWQSCPKYFIPLFPGYTSSNNVPHRVFHTKDTDRTTPMAFIPDKILEYVELVLDENAEIHETSREPGQNDCGMVAWRVLMRTPEFPRGRRMILVGNDLTFQMGTFGIQEDLLYQRVSQIARKEGIPRIYIAANSGARMGLAKEVQDLFQVEWIDANNPAKGFKSLYVDETDYQNLCLKNSVVAEPVLHNTTNASVYRLTSVIGSEMGLGVENLCGSGAIAGETSRSYNSNVTITFVTGRTVGIGAYISRLGHRVIQKASSAPILLTGYQVINRLSRRDVYTSNDELGGVDVMAKNGVTHIVVGNDIEGCEEIVRWLSYVPEHRDGALPIMVDPTDPITRPVLYRVSSLTEDPRLMLTGCLDAKGQWLGGIFDRGSFREVLADWAKSVIVGRARLGGIPVGVIAVETRVTETVVPADSAIPDSVETTLLRPGQMWFPDSAYKTAQAISDFNREEIPLIIFANWRGFSGGQRDMFHEVCKISVLFCNVFFFFFYTGFEIWQLYS
jgi:acetyl-CoA carboxylase / biotin carboxylase 1